MTISVVLSEVRNEALKTLRENLPPDLDYHSYEHTLDVLESAERIARGEKVSEEELEIVKTAAVFHDIGYIYSRENHEERSCLYAREKLGEKGLEKSIIDQVCRLILATHVPQQPKDRLSEIICDADLDYLGRDDYEPISRNVFKEFRKFGVVNSEKEWKEMQIRFLESHNYFTATANRLRKAKKAENLERIRKETRQD